jgi:molecular chaperone DnaK
MAMLDTQGKSHLIPNADGGWIHRSSIEFLSNGDYRVGSDSPNALRYIKRSIGIRETVSINGEPWSLRLLIAMILKSMVRNAEEYIGGPIHHVVLSMPTDFGLAQKRILAESAEIAGIRVARIVQESSVESFLSRKTEEHYAAFIDLGGGTLDITLSEVGDGVMEVLYSDGDSGFGSLDFDRELEKLLRQKLLTEYNVRAENLEVLAEQVKCRLGEQTAVSVTYLSEDAEGNLRILLLMVSRAEFEEAAGTQIRVFRDKLGKLAEIQLKVPPEAIYLTGQGTKLYVLKQLIREVFPQVEVIDRYQENAVIRGLCHQLAIFEGFEHKLLMATLPGSLYILGSEQSDADIVIEPIRNPIKVKLLENDNTIPTRKSRIVTFAFAEGEELPKMFPVELLERTVSGKEYMLYSTFVTAEPGKQYELTVDIDANLRARVTLRGTETKTACVKTLL